MTPAGGAGRKKEGRIVVVRYLDHVEFRNLEGPSPKPIVREAVGWLAHEDETTLVLVWDRPAERWLAERFRPKVSGLALLKGDVVEITEVA